MANLVPREAAVPHKKGTLASLGTPKMTSTPVAYRHVHEDRGTAHPASSKQRSRASGSLLVLFRDWLLRQARRSERLPTA
ncbi:MULTISPECIES: hypothetical protein [unclassified Chelatococcus]|uniref:hypothetical protein n=1 Tax=Chelatococcus sp. GW1 TaxID=1211115 RepID=UPI0012E18D7F|nr:MULTISPECIES: hypothetical protein [unclassified Chelatococcus]